MKRVLILLIVGLFLVSFVIAIPQDSANSSQNKENVKSNALSESSQKAVLAKKIIQTRNRIKANIKANECPENCTCDGSVMKCQINNQREMTIRAGNSGNTIVQVKDTNMSTKVVLYKSEGKVYGVFKNNQTKIIKVLPDEVKKKIRQRIKARLENHNITLDEDGIYQVQARKQARLFFMFPVKEKVKIQMNSETGEIIRTKTSWWGWMAKDIKDDSLEE